MNLFEQKNIVVNGLEMMTSEDLVSSLQLLSRRKVDGRSLAIGEHENSIFTEVKTENIISMFVFDQKKKTIRGLRLNPTTRYVEGDFGENLEDKIAAVAALITYAEANDEDVAKAVRDFIAWDKKGATLVAGSDEAYDLICTIRDIESKITVLCRTKGQPLEAFSKTPAEINLSKVETGMLTPSKIIVGHFEGFKGTQKEAQKVSVEEIGNKFALDPSRELTPEEKAMVWDIPKWFDISPTLLSVAEKVKASWDGDPNLRKNNILFEGPKGTGKTKLAQALSALFGLPYTKETCFSDMDSSNVVGTFLPVADETAQLWIPTEDEIFFDPAGCYEKLTGEKLDEEQKMNISEDDVQKAIEEAYEKDASKDTTPRYVYFPSEIVRAFENGWLCEIQEPTCIADAAVLMILNSALEKDGVLNLPHRTVKRHPDCVFVITTNRDYEGCRPLNQALRDRFNLTKKMDLPGTDEVISRLKAVTGCNDIDFLRMTVESVNALNGFLHNNGINDSVSLRGMQDFVADVMRGFDIRESAMEDMVYKISTDDDEVAEMESFLEVSTQLFN